MEEINAIKESIEKRRNFYRAKCEKIERQQIDEYNALFHQSKYLKENRKRNKEVIVKNLKILIAHNHGVQKLIYDSEHVSSLPVSYSSHQEVVQLVDDMIQFINNLHEPNGLLDMLEKQKDINITKLNENIEKCIDSVGSELYRARLAITQVNTIRKSMDILQEYCLNDTDENSDVNSPVSSDLL